MNGLTEKYRQRLVILTQSLVDIPTVNMPPHGAEKEGQEYVKACLQNLGMSVAEFSPCEAPDFEHNPAFIPGQDYTGRKSVRGVWKGSGGGRAVILNGHMDVVNEEPGPWTKCEPFKSVVENGRIYGRGTADMKGGLACALTAIEMLKDEGFTPKGDIIFESVVDEEYASSAGSISLRQLGLNADFAVLFEPTGLTVCPACVGSIVLKVTMQGVAGMPYTGETVVNPIYMLGEAIGIIREYEKSRLEGVKPPKLWEETPQAVQLVITKAKSGDIRPNGQLSTPTDAWIELVIQTYPHEDMETIFQEFKEFLSSRFSEPDKLVFELEYHFCRASDMHPDTRGVEALKRCADRYAKDARICGAMFSCDLFAFTLYGNMPAAVFGPAGEKLHGPDEWVGIDSMEKTTLAVRDFIMEWCG
jgi:acetylornithine deacetylase